MYRNDFENKILKANIAPNYFMFYGAEIYQVESYTKEYLARFDGEKFELSFDEYNFELAKKHLEQNSLFGNINILHIKTDKKIPQKELKALISLCQNNEQNIFAYELHEGDQKVAGENAKAFDENFVRFFETNKGEAFNLLKARALKLNLKITEHALFKILQIHNDNLYLSAAELNKIATLYENADEILIDNLVSNLSGISYEAFFNKLITNANIKNDFFNIVNEGSFNEIMFISMLYSSFLRLFKINSFSKLNGRFDIKEAIGYAPPQAIANTLKTQALSFNDEIFLAIFRHINESEEELKKAGNNGDKELFLLHSLLKLQEIIAKYRKY